jgi:uncharacterized protein involved in exopolysaccharide biosynthesis
MFKQSIYFNRLKADKWLVLLIAAIITGLGLWAVLTTAPLMYVSKAKVWIRNSSRVPYIISLERYESEKPATMAANPILTQLELMTSSQVASDHFEFLRNASPLMIKKLEGAEVSPEEYLRGHLKANNMISTETVQLEYRANKPDLAQNALNNVLENYLTYRHDIEYGGKNRQSKDIDKRVKDTEARLMQVRNNIRDYETRTGSNDVGKESGELVTKRLEAQIQVAELNAQISATRASVKSLSAKLPYKNVQSAINAVAMGAPGPLLDLRQQLADAKQQYEFDAIKLAPTNPKLVAQSQKISEIQRQINQEIRTVLGRSGKTGDTAIYDNTRTKLVNDLLESNVKLQNLLAQEGTLNHMLSGLRQEEYAMPTKKYTLKNLMQEEANLAEAYDALKKQQLEAHLKGADSMDNILVVIDKPSLPTKEQSPTQKQLAALALLLGLGAGVGFSLLKTRLTGFCSNATTMRNLTQRPVLATIPWYATGYQQPGRMLAMDNASEEAVAKLLIEIREHRYQVLAITSDCQGTHRPTQLMQLGRKFADSGYRVALIDANFRTPSLACRVEIHPEQSLSQLIERFNNPMDEGTANSLMQEYAYQDPDNGCVCLLNEQPLPSPARYFSSPGFMRLLHHMRKHFQVVLVNTPSILSAPEATTITSLSDAVVAVTSYAVQEATVVQMTEQLEAIQKPFLGTIIRELR